MEKKIVTVSALCFLMIGAIAVAGIMIDNEMVRRVVVIAGCLVVVWLTTLNFKYLKLMKRQAEACVPVVPSLVHWLQGETWPEILSLEKIKIQFRAELAEFLEIQPDCEEAAVKGYRIWRSEETEPYFEKAGLDCQQILVLMDSVGERFQVFGSETLQKAMEERSK